ncbi:DUF1330 domain-containing protein [Primorskyibacter flagellatus]|uniref:DUF1330 domain-containing protein n=1 Tax=Primorskyibacter flagellatus TaxID=1387277 RepID=A0A917A6K6_9RHOB|nr:DUF1330 domain-containing protein [Primorskyibacter flagellatus]GGE26379.1 DUF1330 domain-containing protein [Primorskyibacter flagellatus]
MTYLAPTEASARALIARGMDRPVVMLNLLRFHAVADYNADPDMAPDTPVSGAEAYELYVDGIAPLLTESGGAVLFRGDAGGWLIGPEGDGWDHVMLVRQASVRSFLSFAQDPAAQRYGAHRTAALLDSRLLPVSVAD